MNKYSFFQRRRIRKNGREWLRHLRHHRRMREDTANPADVSQARSAEAALKDSLKQDDVDRIPAHCERAKEIVSLLAPSMRFAAVRENFEVLVVAVAVAMAFRTYFLQPFKIPTGSMQPTLYGIHYEQQDGPNWMDTYPLRFVKWALFGEWFEEFTARSSGQLRGPFEPEQGGMRAYEIGGTMHYLPSKLPLLCRPGQDVVAGQRLAWGNRVTGDHLFVNRVKWNLFPPQRGEVMVFRTDGIPPYPGLTPDTHYIKRLCGLPGDRISINPPNLIVDGKPVTEPETIARIARRSPGYAGYSPAAMHGACFIRNSTTEVHLEQGEYLALGDNTQNSLDSRYWGPVPERNLVGPALVVYWPLSHRWGPIH